MEEKLKDVPVAGSVLSDIPQMVAMIKGYVTGKYTNVSIKVIATLVAAFGGHWGNFLSMFVMVLFGLVLYPIILMKGTAGGSKNARKK